MFSVFRRRKPASLSLLQHERAAPEVADSETATVEPEQEKLAAAELILVDLPPALPEPNELEAKSRPAEFAPAGPAVSNLYAIPNVGIKFAVAQKLPEEPAVEIVKDSEPPQTENFAETPVAKEGDAAAQQALSIWQAVAAAGNSVSQSPAEEAPIETEGGLESSVVEGRPDQSVAGHQADAAEEFKAVEVPITEKTLPAESASADDVPIEHAATDSPVAEAGVEIVSIEPVVPDVTEVGSSTSDEVEREVAHRLAVLEDALRRQVSAAPSKPKRRWWSFWRKRQPAEQSVVAKESSAIVSPVAEGVSENSAPEEIAGESSTSESSTEILTLDSIVPDLTEADLPADVLVTHKVDEVEPRPDESLALDVLGIERPAAEPLSETMPAIEDALEMSVTETHAGEIVEAGKAPTTAEAAVLDNVEAESPANEAEQIALSFDSALSESAGIDATDELENVELPLTESSDLVSVSQDPIPEPSIANPTAAESEIIAGAHSSEVPTPQGDISIVEKDAPESESPVAREEGIPANVLEVGEVSRSSFELTVQSKQSADGFGLLDLPRIAEPEVMDDSEEVEAYTSATAQAWLDKIDDSFVEHAVRLVKGRQRGRALDIGTGPGQIALKLALRLSLWKVIGVDRSQKMIDEALAKLAATAPVTGRLEFRVADGNRLDFPNATFDLVICNSVLHHFAEPRNLLAELARVTKPRGAILLRDLRRPSRLKYPFHVRWHGRHYDGAMGKLYRDSVRAAYTVPELQRLLDSSPLRGARVFRHGSTHIGLERSYDR